MHSEAQQCLDGASTGFPLNALRRHAAETWNLDAKVRAVSEDRLALVFSRTGENVGGKLDIDKKYK